MIFMFLAYKLANNIKKTDNNKCWNNKYRH